MIGKYVDETKMSREDAYKFIAKRCDDCELAAYCTDKYDCMEKVSYLIKKYSLDAPEPGTHMRFPETLKVLLEYKHISIRKFEKLDVEMSTKNLQEQLDSVIDDLDILCNSIIYAQQKLNRIKCMGGTEN